MAISITSLSRNGLRDWLIQRVTAAILGLYVLFFIIYFFANANITFSDWHSLFTNPWMRYFSFLALLSIALHAWVGVWTIFTDYVKCQYLRLSLHIIVFLALVGYLVWGVEILWGL